jgi:Short C-terminal domain
MLVALDDRLLIIKAGVFAGTTFGARVATIFYRDITGIEVNTGLLNCVVEVSTASYPANREEERLVRRPHQQQGCVNRDPRMESNTIPVIRLNLKKWESHLAELREMISAQKRGAPAVAIPAEAEPTLAAQLKELADLHEQGALSNDEFAQAKAQLLSLLFLRASALAASSPRSGSSSTSSGSCSS